jgi:DNA invertase Pin-like site-specific DNA recombinase
MTPTATAPDLDACRRGLREAARRRERADRLKAKANAELAELIRQGLELELPVTEIARLAGLSRWSVYDFLKRETPRP